MSGKRVWLVAFVMTMCSALAAQDGGVDTGFDPGAGATGPAANNVVRALALQPDGRVLIGGGFTAVDGVAINRIARLNGDGSLDTSFDPSTGVGTGITDSVSTLALQPDGKVLIGGKFTSVDGVARNHIARLNADGSLDTTFDPGSGVSAQVRPMALQPDGKVLIGGGFTVVNGVNRSKIARLNADGSLDTTFDPGSGANAQVDSLAVQPNGKVLIGGHFTTVNGVAINRIARLNADGSLDTTFDPGAGADNRVQSLAVQPNGKVLIGGIFASVDGVSRSKIARLNADGSLDTPFDPGAGPNAHVQSLAVQPDGKVVIGGAFTSVNGVVINRVARLNADGSLDTTFDPGSGVNNWVKSLALQPDGKLLIGGYFMSVGGLARAGVARLNNPSGAGPVQIYSTPVTYVPVNGAYSYKVSAWSGTTVAISVQNLPSWLTFDNVDTISGTAPGTPQTTGVITITADDGSTTDTQQFQINVGIDPPAITSTPPTLAYVGGSPYSYTLTATGDPAAWFSVGGLPSWLTFDNVDTISGTPSATDAGTSASITVTATNQHGTDSQQVQIEVVMAPIVTSTPPTTATVGALYSYTVTADGWPTPSFSFIGGMPGWLSFNGATLSGTPSASDIGPTGTLTIRAENSAGNALDQFNIIVSGAPTFTSTPVTTAMAGASYTYTVTAIGFPTPVLSSVTVPSWLTFNTATGELTGTPGAADIGTAGNDIVIQATSSSGTTTQSFTIAVDGVPPTITSTPVQFTTVGVLYTYTVTTDGIPTPTLSTGNLPGWLSFNAVSGELSGTPTLGDLGLSGQIDITAANGWGTDDVQSFQIQVNGTTPVIVSTPPTATAGVPYSYTVQATGSPAPGFSASGLPIWLSFDNVDTISGTPQQADIGLTGTITVTATNIQGSDDQIFQISVQGQPPQITSTATTTAVLGAGYSYTVTTTGVPAPTLSANGLPSWLTFDPSTGELSGTPSTQDFGTSGAITITATNGWGADATQTFSITVDKPFSSDSGKAGGGCVSRSSAGPVYGALVLVLLLVGIGRPYADRRRRSRVR